MLRSIQQLYGDRLKAIDGEIGRIKDFYFDDVNWTVRYVVIETGSWFAGNQVVLSPHVFTKFDQDGVGRCVNLTLQQIKDSPNYDTQKPVSRQFEEEYHAYYGWPNYWEVDGFWGLGDYPFVEPINQEESKDAAMIEARTKKMGDVHLRSTSALKGYQILTPDGEIGHVADFIIHEKTWNIKHVIVETGHWYSGKEIALSPKDIKSIDYEASMIEVTLTKEAIQTSPQYDVPAWAFDDQDVDHGSPLTQ